MPPPTAAAKISQKCPGEFLPKFECLEWNELWLEQANLDELHQCFAYGCAVLNKWRMALMEAPKTDIKVHAYRSWGRRIATSSHPAWAPGETLLERGAWEEKKKSGKEVRKRVQRERKIYLVGPNLVDKIYDSEWRTFKRNLSDHVLLNFYCSQLGVWQNTSLLMSK